jgi:molecular chaperone DnaJ
VRATRSIDVDVPGGIETGQRIHLPGSGEVGHGGGPAGDLYLEFTVNQHPIFHRVGDDLVATIEVDMTDAIMGTSVTLDALDGDVEVEIRPGVQNDDTLTFKSRGVTKLRGAGRGDLALHVHITTPTKLGQKETELVKTLRELRSPEPPHLRGVGQKKFQRLRDRFFGG